jgi:hypothetical protein
MQSSKSKYGMLAMAALRWPPSADLDGNFIGSIK